MRETETEMLLRPATESDAQAIATFICMAEGEMVEFFTGMKEVDEAVPVMMEYVLSPEPCRYSLSNNIVAELDGRPAGSVICFPADSQPALDGCVLRAVNQRGYNLDSLFFEGAPGTFYLSTMGVDPEFRGRGVGSALMAKAEEEGRQRGFAQTSLLVSKEKPRARALYERVGYATTEEVSMGGHAYYRMRKHI